MARCVRLMEWSPVAGDYVTKRFIRPRDGEALVKRDRAEEITDTNGRVVAFVLIGIAGKAPAQTVATRRATVMASSQVAKLTESGVFSRGEVEAIAGTAFCDGQSETAALPEWQRLQRMRDGENAEDLIERALEKKKIFAESRLR